MIFNGDILYQWNNLLDNWTSGRLPRWDGLGVRAIKTALYCTVPIADCIVLQRFVSKRFCLFAPTSIMGLSSSSLRNNLMWVFPSSRRTDLPFAHAGKRAITFNSFSVSCLVQPTNRDRKPSHHRSCNVCWLRHTVCGCWPQLACKTHVLFILKSSLHLEI